MYFKNDDDEVKNNIQNEQPESKENDYETYEDELKTVFNEENEEEIDEDEAELEQNQEGFQVSSQLIESEADNIVPKYISEEVRTSFLEYAMSVIISRALPDVRDGLKPVHRRILHCMNELGITHSVAYKKSARIVGDVLGKYHPHGDASVYDSMVRMSQDFALRYPLIDGHGNFGSIDGDEAAAMRYTEARMSKIASLMVEDIKKNTVDFVPNYDGSEQEPQVLPARFPNLLVSGVSGIAVGMATKIPPHNLKEVIETFILLAQNPDISVQELAKHLPAPDFPTGATILGTSGIRQAYETGRGAFVLRSKAKIETFSSGKSKIIVYEIPYEVKKPQIIEKVVQLVRDKKIQGLKDVRDETNRKGIRVVFDVKKGFSPEIILNQLYKETDLQITYNINMLALVNGIPKVLNLKDILYQYLLHQEEVVTRGLQFDLKKAKERHNILLGIKIAVENIDEVIKIIRASKSDAEAQTTLGQRFDLNEAQTKAIVDMRLGRLTSLAIEKLIAEIKELEEEIERITSIINSHDKLIELIVNNHKKIIESYADDRRTEIVHGSIGQIVDEDLIKEQKVVLTLTKNNYIKRINLDEYRMQNRGGTGSSTATTYKDDNLKNILVASTHSDLLILTSKARIFRLRTHQIPDLSKQAKGVPFINLIPIEKDEDIVSLLVTQENYEDDNLYLVTVSKLGIIKKTSLSLYKRISKNGLIALNLKENDELLTAFITTEESEIIIGASNGRSVRFDNQDFRSLSRKSMGVKGITLGENEVVVGASSTDQGSTVFVLGQEGYGKKTHIDEYRKTARGGKGVITLKTEKAGNLAFISCVKGDEEILILTKQGIVIRTSLEQCNDVSRNTKGVKLITLKPKDSIQSVAVLEKIYEL
ncbi:DNA gyrase subunit A [Mesomycoplasma hyorhinis]|uniref:DNA gyrase subunit A n=3 Tax=Mesomycoplasma hyorhinis TaxID=2100 RepID=A0ABD6II62_MESHY|nr:DNA gyrase subunit A [Mesomycoplasma hyorhinis]AEC45867.1 DNA gyrase subunit A [Mesomycoplasma hyorhinis MCLD]AEX13918.1 DNA gyrase, A subunit [Mesomycoplasma hyorhinis GDL-1]AFX74058.1 DNA gyrase subunit A [Mesomycoplasma hyorhinis SK76]AHA40880.1 DNA gyrase, A subunit [Mesomycoplasma hyorhinis DBS 1050]TRM83610.1 DNA gyrase subunit A [Sulfolobus sp. A20-N-F6]